MVLVSHYTWDVQIWRPPLCHTSIQASYCAQDLLHQHCSAPRSGVLTLTDSSCSFAAAFSRYVHRTFPKHFLFPSTLMSSWPLVLCGLFMLFYVLCSQDALDATFEPGLLTLQPQRRMCAQPMGAVLPLTGRREASLMVIEDLWLVTGCLLSPPAAFWRYWGALLC